MQEKGKVVDLDPEEDVEEIHMVEEDIDIGMEDVDVEGSNYPSTFLYLEVRQRFQRTLMKARSRCTHPC